MPFLAALLVILLAAAASPWRAAPEIYDSGVFQLLALLLAALSLCVSAAAIARKKWLAACLHAAVPLIAAGALLDAARGDRVSFATFVGPEFATDTLPDTDTERETTLDFTLAVLDFSVEFYPQETSPEPAPPVASRYAATVKIERDGHTRTETLAVNHPLDIGQWRFYPTSHGTHEGRAFVSLLAKRSPGSPLIKTGITLLALSTLLLAARTNPVRPSSIVIRKS